MRAPVNEDNKKQVRREQSRDREWVLLHLRRYVRGLRAVRQIYNILVLRHGDDLIRSVKEQKLVWSCGEITRAGLDYSEQGCAAL